MTRSAERLAHERTTASDLNALTNAEVSVAGYRGDVVYNFEVPGALLTRAKAAAAESAGPGSYWFAAKAVPPGQTARGP